MEVMRPLLSVAKLIRLAAVVGGAQMARGIVVQRDAHGGAIQDGEQSSVGAEGARGGGRGGAQDIGAVGGAGQRIGGVGDGEKRGGSGRGGETIGASRSAAQHESAVGICGERIAQTEGPADSQHAAAGVVHIERVFERQRGRGTAEGEIGDADEEGEVGSVDEDLREAGIAAGRAAAKRVVGCKAIFAGAAESGLGAIPAGAQTGTSQD